MSSHVLENDKVRWMFGWDQTYRSFFLTKVDKTLASSDNPVIRIGKRPLEIPTPEGLVTLAGMVGLELSQELLLELGKDKDVETNAYFVLHWPDEFVKGFKTDSLSQAELLKDALAGVRPDEELQIRRVKKRK